MKGISEDTLNVVNTLKAYSENGLRKEKDFTLLLENCASSQNHDRMHSLLLSGAALRNLSVKLADAKLPDDAAPLVQREFQDQLERFRALLVQAASEFVSSGDADLSDQAERMEDIYLERTKGNVMNMIDLATDFYLFKTMQLEHRESRKDS